MFDRRDWLMIGFSAAGLIAALIWRYARRPPRALGANVRSPGLGLPIWLAVGLVVLLAFVAVVVVGRRLQQRRREAQRQAEIAQKVAAGPTVLLLPRADAKPRKLTDIQVWARLAEALPHDEHISFELAGNGDELAFALHGSEDGVRAALTQFRAEWPGMHRKAPEHDLAALPEGWALWWVELAPQRYDDDVEAVVAEPLRPVLIEINGVMGQGRGLLQVIARRNFGVRRDLGQQAFAARDVETPSKGVRALRSQDAKRLEKRARLTYLDATVRAVGMADTPERAQGIARGLARAVAASFDSRNPVQPVRQGDDPEVVLARAPGQMAPWAADDLAALAHLPDSSLLGLAPRLKTAPARYLPAAPEMRFNPARHRTAFLEGLGDA